MENNENKNSDITVDASVVFEENGTYCKLGSPDAGFLEIDLQSFKERGVETRHISLTVVGLDESKENVVKSEMFILNEDSWKKFQSFIAKLNWND
jgi:hypothetical protein